MLNPSLCAQAKAVEPQPVVKKYGPEAKEARKKQQKEAEKRLAEQKLKADEEARRAKAKALYAPASLKCFRTHTQIMFKLSGMSRVCAGRYLKVQKLRMV